jgi:hypothetical protein
MSAAFGVARDRPCEKIEADLRDIAIIAYGTQRDLIVQEETRP